MCKIHQINNPMMDTHWNKIYRDFCKLSTKKPDRHTNISEKSTDSKTKIDTPRRDDRSAILDFGITEDQFTDIAHRMHTCKTSSSDIKETLKLIDELIMESEKVDSAANRAHLQREKKLIETVKKLIEKNEQRAKRNEQLTQMEHFILTREAEEYRDSINYDKNAEEINKVIRKFNETSAEAHSYQEAFSLADERKTTVISVRANLVINETKIIEDANPAAFKITFIYHDGKITKRTEEIPSDEAAKYFESRERVVENLQPTEKMNEELDVSSKKTPVPSTSQSNQNPGRRLTESPSNSFDSDYWPKAKKRRNTEKYKLAAAKRKRGSDGKFKKEPKRSKHSHNKIPHPTQRSKMESQDEETQQAEVQDDTQSQRQLQQSKDEAEVPSSQPEPQPEMMTTRTSTPEPKDNDK